MRRWRWERKCKPVRGRLELRGLFVIGVGCGEGKADVKNKQIKKK